MNAIDESGLAISPVEPHPIECANPTKMPPEGFYFIGSNPVDVAPLPESPEHWAMGIMTEVAMGKMDWVILAARLKEREATPQPLEGQAADGMTVSAAAKLVKRITELKADNAKLRQALEQVARFSKSDGVSGVSDETWKWGWDNLIEIARAALGNKSEVSCG